MLISMFAALFMGALFEGEGDTGAGGGGGVPAAKPPESGKDGEPFAVFKTSKELDDRLKRAGDKELKELFGTADREKIKERWKKADELETAEEERKKAAMTEADRLRAERQVAYDERQKAEAEKSQAIFERDVTRACATLGIKNTDYALYMVGAAHKSDAALNINDYLTEQLKDAKKAAAFDVAVETQQAPLNTSPALPGGDPKPPPPGKQPDPVDVMTLTPAQFQAHLASKGA